MKRLLLPLLLLAGLAAPAFAGTAEKTADRPTTMILSGSEKTRIMSTASRLLSQVVAYRGDGTAASVLNFVDRRTTIEWQGLVIRQLIHGTVTAEEVEAGITRRFYAQLHSSGYRTSVNDGKTWTDWQSGRCPVFPSYLLVEEIDGRFEIVVNDLAKFSPAPDNRLLDPNRKLMPHERYVAKR